MLLCKGLLDQLKTLSSPGEPEISLPIRDDAPNYVKERANLVRASQEWWANLPRFQLGFDVWKIAEELGYRRMILTQGPKRNAQAWAGKKIWIDRNLG